MAGTGSSSDMMERARDAASTQSSGLISANSALLEAFARASENFLRHVAAFNEETLGFAAERLQSNSEASEALTRAKDLADAIHVQQDWVRAATQHYAQQVGRVIEFGTRAALAGFAPALHAAEQGAEEGQRALRNIGEETERAVS